MKRPRCVHGMPNSPEVHPMSGQMSWIKNIDISSSYQVNKDWAGFSGMALPLERVFGNTVFSCWGSSCWGLMMVLSFHETDWCSCYNYRHHHHQQDVGGKENTGRAASQRYVVGDLTLKSLRNHLRLRKRDGEKIDCQMKNIELPWCLSNYVGIWPVYVIRQGFPTKDKMSVLGWVWAKLQCGRFKWGHCTFQMDINIKLWWVFFLNFLKCTFWFSTDWMKILLYLVTFE